MSQTIQVYGAKWPAGFDALQVEMGCIRKGGKWTDNRGNECGLGLFAHYKKAQQLCWPKQDHHRWSDLTLSEILENKITAMLGPQNSNKTMSAAKFGLIDFWAWPECTLILVSSTDVRGLEMRVWGKMKELWQEGIERFPWLAGKPTDHLHAITTDDLEDEDTNVRILNKGIVCIPCLAGGKYVGLGKYVGIKQKRVRLLADEAQLMGPSFLDSISNLGGNPDFKAVIMGNPIDPMDPLGMAAEPEDGWMSLTEPTKTAIWKTRFQGGKAINLVGTDSPNFDYPDDKKPRYPYLIHKWRIDEIVAFWGSDSQQYYSQAVGVMKTGLLARRVITMELCRQHNAFSKALWQGTERTKIMAMDIAYGGVGGDRCVKISGEFGPSVDGQIILRVNPPVLVPVSIRLKLEPEDQIAAYAKRELELEGIPIENLFYDSTGRGTMGSAFARQFGDRTPVPVEFGGRPSKRPVRHDLFIHEQDEYGNRIGEQRHKRCDEHFYDFVSELWLVSRYAIEADQIRELPETVAKEGCQREYGTSKGNKLFVESKHDPKARERMTQSPDLYDAFVTLIEGARQRGFKIQKLGVEFVEDTDEDFSDADEWRDTIKSKLLTHA